MASNPHAVLASLWIGYIGPGPGLAVQGPALLLLLGLVAALLALLTWPIRWLFRKRKPRGPGKLKRLIIVGLDGLEPGRTNQFLEEGRLPNLQSIATKGCYRQLGTTTPPLSPVAWSTFSTGVNPGKHGVFDFVKREPDYKPSLSISGTAGPEKRPKFLRRSKSFWTVLGEHGVSSHVVRVPVSWPPEKFNGFLLSSMGTPDLMGTQGTYTVFGVERPDPMQHGDFVMLEQTAEGYRGCIPGPNETSVEFSFDGVTLCLAKRQLQLSTEHHTDWVELSFGRYRGLAKFLLLSPRSFYMTALQIHPTKPAAPLSHPPTFSVALSKILGRFATCGLAEDLGATDDGILSLDAFLDQSYQIHEERERQFFHCLSRTRSGLCAVVFDGTDRIQHMTLCPEKLAQLYERMDRLIGRVLNEMRPGDELLVLSDHGFKPLDRLVDLNAWLSKNGYLKFGDDGIDWTETRAYTLGLAGISLNLQGREHSGVVCPKDAPALRAELKQRLQGLRDGEVVAIPSVLDAREAYHGPYVENAPDLIIGYQPGYGVNKEAARGKVGRDVFQDNHHPWVADHCFQADLVPGVLFSTLELCQSGSLQDIAPTVLELFGVPTPSFYDGRSLLKPDEAPLRSAS